MTVPRLTSLSSGAGCGCKLGATALESVLGALAPTSHPDLVVGTDTGDDALVWRQPRGPALVASCDFFTPLVDDARTWGRIAAANAVSDVYAMGGVPRFALNLVAWPEVLPPEQLTEVLDGAASVAAEGGWVIAGGHSIGITEPLYGQAVVGEVDPDAVLTNAGARAGDALVLTKPLGTGVLATAVRGTDPSAVAPGGTLAPAYEDAVSSMTRLNDDAAAIARAAGATAVTDVTGFGLLGHLHKMARASGVRAVVDPAEVPVLHGAWELLADGHSPGGTGRNLAFVADHLDRGGHDEAVARMLADPQTSGGLLIACPAEAAGDALAALAEAGLRAEDVGEVVGVGDGRSGEVLLR